MNIDDITDEELCDISDSELDELFDLIIDYDKLCEETRLEEEQLDEAPMSLQQRRKRAMKMRRLQPRIQRRKKQMKKRKASPEKLKLRSRRAALKVLRKKVAGKKGSDYVNLKPSEKISIDKQVERRKSAVGRIAKRLMPKVRKKEMERVKQARQQRKEEVEMKEKQLRDVIENRESVNEMFDAFFEDYEITQQKNEQALKEKARENEIPFYLLKEVYERGINDYYNVMDENHTASQWAFARVNSFINDGLARKLDEDIYRSVEKSKRINELLSENTDQMMVELKNTEPHEVSVGDTIDFEKNGQKMSGKVKKIASDRSGHKHLVQVESVVTKEN